MKFPSFFFLCFDEISLSTRMRECVIISSAYECTQKQILYIRLQNVVTFVYFSFGMTLVMNEKKERERETCIESKNNNWNVLYKIFHSLTHLIQSRFFEYFFFFDTISFDLFNQIEILFFSSSSSLVSF